MLTPGFEEFARLSAARLDGVDLLVPVAKAFVFDADTAITAYHKLRRPPFGFLLESVVGGEKWARYTFVGAAPRSAWRLGKDGGVSTWSPGGGWTPPRPSADPLAELDTLLEARRPVDLPGLPRFTGGAVGYIGYDVIRHIETLPGGPAESLDVPDALLLFTDAILAIDNLFGRAHAIVMAEVDAGADDDELRRIHDGAVARIDEMIATLATAPGPAAIEMPAATADIAFESSYSRNGYERDVERIREYILAGDAFQVVLSQRLVVELKRDPFDIYRALRSVNPAPYLFFLELDGTGLVGSSPEVLVRVEDGTVTVRPIAGTRPRGRTEEHDAELAEELLADPKECAEHLMLVDLGRNDVGRVARFGSVRVTSFMNIEKYSHVQHMVSQVEGTVRDDVSALDVFRACFPAGTVSGAPKIRAMEIIDELEPVRRGIYAGAVGYFGYGGQNMDTAIAIRTLVYARGRAYVQAGAGIVADSVPSREYEETIAKARALLRTL
ncbi:anthranilate synthase component I [soil metagenome]